jgi:hypothetical protein
VAEWWHALPQRTACDYQYNAVNVIPLPIPDAIPGLTVALGVVTVRKSMVKATPSPANETPATLDNFVQTLRTTHPNSTFQLQPDHSSLLAQLLKFLRTRSKEHIHAQNPTVHFGA